MSKYLFLFEEKKEEARERGNERCVKVNTRRSRMKIGLEHRNEEEKGKKKKKKKIRPIV